MIEYIPYVFEISLSLAIGLVVIFLYRKRGKGGLALVAVAFFLIAVPSIVQLVMGGPYLAIRLMEQGYVLAEIESFVYQLFLLSSIFKIVFAILVIVGLAKLSR